MAPKRLQPHVDQIQNIIQAMDAADECTTGELKAIAEELNLAIANPKQGTPVETIIDQLEQELIKFSDKHPALAEAIQQLLDGLKNIGV
ncbi:DUF4404 family protein [Endozoicomonas sp. SM1973]|uniref:DUF4404 family protein n=1 Tax=Spartinivicinus marinus TaxID=2994442 RepID=A0A853HZG1_9GAMM|nr:DUF4404 family protein [Spartinivicinus marinus]MCX4026658.1 DUF4404 family protein [Spartinivicinus marinus]NYZ64492.1 DUF4404 family protein [Spartinivicinus marinus]